MVATEATNEKPIIIGIAGGTGAGKTTFAKSIYSACGGTGWGTKPTEDNVNVSDTIAASKECNITHLSHDDYYKDLTHLTIEERAQVNFDAPSSLDTDLLISHLKELLQGQTVIVPRYDYKRHCRYAEGEVDEEGRSSGRVVESKGVILVEGILILSLSLRELTNLMDLKVFVVRIMQNIEHFVCGIHFFNYHYGICANVPSILSYIHALMYTYHISNMQKK